MAHPGWPQVLRYRRRRAMAVRRVPAYRERWGPGASDRAPWVDEAELDARLWTLLPLGVELRSLPPGPPSVAGIVAAVALTGPLGPWPTVLECRRDWRPAGRGEVRRDVRVLTLLDADAPGDPVRVARLRDRTWSELGSGQVVLVGSARQLEHAVTDVPARLAHRVSGSRSVERLDVRTEAGRLAAAGAAVAHTPHLGYLAGRVPDCGQLHLDWRRTYVREGTSGIHVTVLRGRGPVLLDVHVPGPGLSVCTRHHGWVLTPH